MYIPRTQRRVGVHQMPIASPKKIGGMIKTVALPKLPKINANMLPKPHPFPNKIRKIY